MSGGRRFSGFGRPSFALVAAMLMLGLVMLGGVAATTLLRTELQAAKTQQWEMLARQYARCAFDQALMHLQASTGVDTRVTAPGDLYLEPEHPASNWVGSWNSGSWSPDQPQERAFVGWLASGQSGSDLNNPVEALQLSAPLARFQEGDRLLYAPFEVVRLESPAGAGRTHHARLAWCIRDESQKLRIDLSDTSDDRVPGGYGLSTLASGDETVPSTILEATLQPSQAGFIEGGVALASAHRMTTTSEGLLCDVRRGGLRQALLPILYEGQDPGFALLEPPAEAPEVPRPTWQSLRSQLVGHLDESGEALEPRGWGELWRPGSEAWSAPPSQEADEIGFGPVLLRALVSLDVTRDADAHLLLGWQVSVVLWNPYDQPLADHAYALRLHEAPGTLPSLLRLSFGQNADGLGPGNQVHVPLTGADVAQPRAFFTVRIHAGFAPGEVRLFSTRTGHLSAGLGPAFDLAEGDDPGVAVWQRLVHPDLQDPLTGAFELELSRAVGVGVLDFEWDWRDLEWTLHDAHDRVIQLVSGLGHSPWLNEAGEVEPPPSTSSGVRTFASFLALPNQAEAPLPEFEPWMSGYFVRKCALPTGEEALHETGPWLALHEPGAGLSIPGRFQYFPDLAQEGESGVRPGNWAWRGGWLQPSMLQQFNRSAFLNPGSSDLFAPGEGRDLAVYPVFQDAREWYSLGQLRHLRLHLPEGPPQRFGQSGAHPRIQRSDTWAVAPEEDTGVAWHSTPEQERLLDARWLINDRLWDGVYCFGDVTQDASGRWRARASERLSAIHSQEVLEGRTPATAFVLQGPFNVNSTDPDAWLAFLASGLSPVDGAKVAFDRGLDSDHAVSPSWAEPLSLEVEADLRPLAVALAEEVRLRGPFMGLGDFVNRRLVTSSSAKAAHGVCGTLDAALIKAGINGPATLPTQRDLPWFEDAHVATNERTGLPGYARQEDLLEKLGPLLTARGDTFTIQACAEVMNPLTGEVEASAQCRGVVQRLPEWMDPADAPDLALAELQPVNQSLGRRYVVREFAWIR